MRYLENRRAEDGGLVWLRNTNTKVDIKKYEEGWERIFKRGAWYEVRDGSK